MRKVLILAFVLLAGMGHAATNDCAGPLVPIPGGFEELDVSSTALPFTAALYGQDPSNLAILAEVTVEEDAVRVRVDGVAPTATVGQLWPVGSKLYVCGRQNIRNFQVIRVTGDADVTVTYYRMGDN